MEINSRMGYIARKILDNAEKVYIEDLLNALGMTKRSFYYDIEKMNAWLKCYHLGNIRICGGYAVLDTPSKEALLELLETQTAYFFTAEERMALEIFYIALAHEVTTIEKLRRNFDVSKNTVLSDIRKQKEIVKKYHLEIRFTPQRGYFIYGEEFLIRNFLSEQLDRLKSVQTQKMIKGILMQSFASFTGKEIDFYQVIASSIAQYEKNIGAHFVDSFVKHAALLVMAAVVRCWLNEHFSIDSQEKSTIKKTNEYLNVLEMIQHMAGQGIIICAEENYYITILLLGIKNFDLDRKVSADGFVNEVADQFIANFEKNARINIRAKENLKTRLILHLKPMYYRLKYGIKVENPLLLDIKLMYGDVFALVEKSIKEIGGEIEKIVTQEEIAYLVMYMESHFSEMQYGILGSNHRKRPILIVCGAGVSTSVFIRTQLIDLMGNQFDFALCSVNQFGQKNLDEYLMIISTVRFKALPKHTVYVGPILSSRDKELILSQLNNYKISPGIEFSLCDLMNILREHVSDKEALERINFDLYSFFFKK